MQGVTWAFPKGAPTDSAAIWLLRTESSAEDTAWVCRKGLALGPSIAVIGLFLEAALGWNKMKAATDYLSSLNHN